MPYRGGYTPAWVEGYNLIRANGWCYDRDSRVWRCRDGRITAMPQSHILRHIRTGSPLTLITEERVAVRREELEARRLRRPSRVNRAQQEAGDRHYFDQNVIPDFQPDEWRA